MEGESSCTRACNSSNASDSPRQFFYCMVNSVPESFHTSDLRNFFSEFIEGEKFDLFHFRHRPQLFNEKEDKNENDSQPGTSKTMQSNAKRFCCLVRFCEDDARYKFITRYHSKLWMDKEGNDLPIRCIIAKVNINAEDLKRFASKELHPPKFMPRYEK